VKAISTRRMTMRVQSPSARIHTYLRNISRSEWYERVIDMQDVLTSRGWEFNHSQYELGDLGWISARLGPSDDPSRQNEIWLDVTDHGLSGSEPLWVMGFSSGAELDGVASEVLSRLADLDGRNPLLP
jgi:hypothetical protein